MWPGHMYKSGRGFGGCLPEQDMQIYQVNMKSISARPEKYCLPSGNLTKKESPSKALFPKNCYSQLSNKRPDKSMSKLFSPLTIKDITFKNRLTISPMCQYSSADGFANDWHLVHLGSRAVGGTALVMQEATAVAPEGRITPGDLGLYKDEHIAKLQSITSFIHAQGAVAGIQLAHAGRKAGHRIPWEGGRQIPAGDPEGWQTVAPSAVPFAPGEEAPEALSVEGIRKVTDDFKVAAGRALTAGYKVVEIHAARVPDQRIFITPQQPAHG